MDDVLLGIVLGRLAEFPLPEQAADLLLAALEDDESLAAQLSGQTQPRSAAPAVTTPATPAGAYLQSLTISGFRPFLSHSELEAFFGSPSGLYELLASVLGLEDLALAAARLAQARKAREAELNEVKKRLPDLLLTAALRHHAAHGDEASIAHARDP